MKERKPTTTTIEDWSEVPRFASEAEEAEFWATHSLGDGLLASMGQVPEGVLPPPRPRTRPVAIRFDDATLRRLRVLAERRHKGYQTLLKEFVLERLYEEEKREGIVR
jgi:CopG antitoxin of type II toxin-antitoxin system